MNQPNPLKVLLVGDDAENMNLLAAALEPLSVAMERAGSEHEAGAQMEQKEYCMILLDMKTNGLDMPKIAAALRQDGKTDQLPMLFVGGDPTHVHALSSLQPGIMDYITAPVDPELLRAKVDLFCDLYRQRHELAERNRQIQNELELATRVHEGFLPRSLPVVDKILCSRYHKTCAAMGGDLHDVFSLGRGRIGLYMADVAGHGVSAALLSGLVKMSFETLKEHIDQSRMPVSELLDPGIMLTRTNAALHGGLPGDVFITLMYAVIDPRSHLLRLSTAGHPYPILVKGTGDTAAFLKMPPGPALGPFRDAYFPVATVELHVGYKLVFFTDGLVEAMNEQGDEFGYDRLLDVVKAHGSLKPDELVTALVAELDRHRAGAPFSDDCSILVVQVA